MTGSPASGSARQRRLPAILSCCASKQSGRRHTGEQTLRTSACAGSRGRRRGAGSASGTTRTGMAAMWVHAQVLTNRTLVFEGGVGATDYSDSDAVSAHVAPRHDGASFRGRMVSLHHRRHSAAALRCTVVLGCWQSLCRRERLGAGTADAELPLERCCIGACCAQKWWRICFGGKLDA